MDTVSQYQNIIKDCRALFAGKMKDYGAAFRVLRVPSVTDQIYIKVKNLINYQNTGISQVGDSERDNFVAIVNYSVIGLIQILKGTDEKFSENDEEILSLYDDFTTKARNLMARKNHDYGEAWREMRVSSITDLIFQKILRLKKIEDNGGMTIVSEGAEGSYYDMLNYAVFCLIKIEEKG